MGKKISLLLSGVVAVTGGLLLLPGCLKDHVMKTYVVYEPVYALKSSVLANINGDPGTTLGQTGQIYVKGSFIYLNEPDKGIHVIDNSNPSHPVQTAFLNIPGNLNIGIRNNILYADMFADVLSIDISNIHQARILGMVRNFFTNRMSDPDSNYVIANWIMKDTSSPGVPQGFTLMPGTTNVVYNSGLPVPGVFTLANSSATSQSGTGTAGSEAVMTMVGDYLYAIPEQHSLGLIHIADSTNPTPATFSMVGYDLETIFPLQDKLLVGSKEGVYVYSISNPAQPTKVSDFTHGTACDPVIANSTYAYVTLRSGSYCGGSANELDILNARDITNTTLVKTYPMTSPSGLCLDGSLLFVCDGSQVKIFDASDPDNLQLLSAVSVDNPNDVIAGDHVLMVVANGGLYEYDYTDPSHVAALGSFSVVNVKS